METRLSEKNRHAKRLHFELQLTKETSCENITVCCYAMALLAAQSPGELFPVFRSFEEKKNTI